MSRELDLILSFRKVLEGTGEGMGAAQSLVREMALGDGVGGEVARRLLLGYQLEDALRPITDGPSAEASMLASLVISSKSGSVLATGKKGETLSHLAESWVKAKENRKLEDRVRRVRGIMASGVAGAVSAMIASIGPLLGSLPDISAQPTGHPGSLVLPGAALALISSGLLGVYVSGRKFYVNVMVTALVYGLVALAVAPLASFPMGPWAIK